MCVVLLPLCCVDRHVQLSAQPFVRNLEQRHYVIYMYTREYGRSRQLRLSISIRRPRRNLLSYFHLGHIPQCSPDTSYPPALQTSTVSVASLGELLHARNVNMPLGKLNSDFGVLRHRQVNIINVQQFTAVSAVYHHIPVSNSEEWGVFHSPMSTGGSKWPESVSICQKTT